MQSKPQFVSEGDRPGANEIKLSQMWFTIVPIVVVSKNNSLTCKLHLQKFIKLTPDLKYS